MEMSNPQQEPKTNIDQDGSKNIAINQARDVHITVAPVPERSDDPLGGQFESHFRGSAREELLPILQQYSLDEVRKAACQVLIRFYRWQAMACHSCDEVLNLLENNIEHREQLGQFIYCLRRQNPHTINRLSRQWREWLNRHQIREAPPVPDPSIQSIGVMVKITKSLQEPDLWRLEAWCVLKPGPLAFGNLTPEIECLLSREYSYPLNFSFFELEDFDFEQAGISPSLKRKIIEAQEKLRNELGFSPMSDRLQESCKPRDLTLDELKQVLALYLGEVAEIQNLENLTLRNGQRPIVDFLLPDELLWESIEQWPYFYCDDQPNLALELKQGYWWQVRSQNRSQWISQKLKKKGKQQGRWRQRWQSCCDQHDQPLTPQTMVDLATLHQIMLGLVTLKGCDAIEQSRRLDSFLGFWSIGGEEQREALFTKAIHEAALPIGLWSRQSQPLNAEAVAELKQLIHDGPLETLRQRYWAFCQQADRQLTLLWDAPLDIPVYDPEYDPGYNVSDWGKPA